MKILYPSMLARYLSKEFMSSLFVIFLVFFSLVLLINLAGEMVYLKDKKLENFISLAVILTFAKTTTTIIELSIFIFLFSGTLFFVKIQKNNEINTILLSGISKILAIAVPAIISFMCGMFIIFFLTPLSSATLNFYEKEKRAYSSNDNLIMMNDMGLWFMESKADGFNIIRADKIADNNFSKLKNVTIYNLDQKFNFIKRYDSDEVFINQKKWLLAKTQITQETESLSSENIENDTILQNLSFTSSIDINNLKNYFTDVNTVSFWKISNTIKTLNSRGYSAEELRVKFHKYLSLPFYLFGMILVSTTFTMGPNKQYNTFMYLFFGTILGVSIYFLNDLSISLGLSNKLPLAASVWSPVFLIIFLSAINLIRINER
ncbi:LptF/LptG family permease [Pelagibacteraceae bacterium]|nr:LptF/LptG family permease [Pelagibacteraceae bacterium]